MEEDANGVHYTDNAASVPEKYRNEVVSETQIKDKSSAPRVDAAIPPQSNVVVPPNQNINYQAITEQQRQLAETMKQQQAIALAKSNKVVEGAMQSLTKYMVIWLIIGFVVFIEWLSTLVDIVRSDFTSPSNKIVWVILVVLLPILGMFLYFIFGLRQKCNSGDIKNKEQEMLLARLKPRDPDGKDFIIY
jgi:hypothetical protein